MAPSCRGHSRAGALQNPEWRRTQVAERLFRFRAACGRAAPMLADEPCQLRLNLIEMKAVLFNPAILNLRHQQQQQQRLFRRSPKPSGRVHFHRPDLVQKLIQLLKLVGIHQITGRDGLVAHIWRHFRRPVDRPVSAIRPRPQQRFPGHRVVARQRRSRSPVVPRLVYSYPPSLGAGRNLTVQRVRLGQAFRRPAQIIIPLPPAYPATYDLPPLS